MNRIIKHGAPILMTLIVMSSCAKSTQSAVITKEPIIDPYTGEIIIIRDEVGNPIHVPMAETASFEQSTGVAAGGELEDGQVNFWGERQDSSGNVIRFGAGVEAVGASSPDPIKSTTELIKVLQGGGALTGSNRQPLNDPLAPPKGSAPGLSPAEQLIQFFRDNPELGLQLRDAISGRPRGR
jgi:hypothetical protein